MQPTPGFFSFIVAIRLMVGCTSKSDETGSSESTGGTLVTTTGSSEVTTSGIALTTMGETDGSGSEATGSGTGADFQELCQALTDALIQQIAPKCVCAVAEGAYENQAECIADYSPSVEVWRCFCEFYARFPETKGALDCRLKSEEMYATCLPEAACDDQAALDACFNPYFKALSVCPHISKQAGGEAIIKCLDEPVFVCSSGESIPMSYRCDLLADCRDSSDELGC